MVRLISSTFLTIFIMSLFYFSKFGQKINRDLTFLEIILSEDFNKKIPFYIMLT